MNFKQDYEEWIKEKREEWVGREVIFEGHKYKVMDVDYNGALLINKKAEYTDTTAVAQWMVKYAK